jgi:hypothetical protein
VPVPVPAVAVPTGSFFFLTGLPPGRFGGGAPVCDTLFSGQPETDVCFGRMCVVWDWNATFRQPPTTNNQQPTCLAQAPTPPPSLISGHAQAIWGRANFALLDVASGQSIVPGFIFAPTELPTTEATALISRVFSPIFLACRLPRTLSATRRLEAPRPPKHRDVCPPAQNSRCHTPAQ